MTSFPPDSVVPIVTEIAEILSARRETVSVSEAACGGLLSAYLVSVPGASNWFHGGTLVYSLKSKLKLSGWSQEEIDTYTGPSEKVVLRLARNLRVDLGSTYVLSETGIAGPSTDPTGALGSAKNESLFSDKDIGTVYLGVSTPNGEKSKVIKTPSRDRSFNMQSFAKNGLEFFLEELKEQLAKESVVETNASESETKGTDDGPQKKRKI